MRARTGCADDKRLVDLCESAFYAEHRRRWDEAYHLHCQAIEELTKIVDNAEVDDKDRKQMVKRQIGEHEERVERIRPVKDGTTTGVPDILPSKITVEEELDKMVGEKLPIGQEQILLTAYLKEKELFPSLDPHSSVSHLLQAQIPFFTPTLDSNQPTLSYHIYESFDAMGLAKVHYYLKAKSASENENGQTLYTLEAIQRIAHQVKAATLRRISESMTPCVHVKITAITTQSNKGYQAGMGRPLTFHTSGSVVIKEEPDRLDTFGWGNRRFTYGGRQFVWVTEDKKGDYAPQSCYEVEKVWPKEGSKTGKKEHKLVDPGRPITWGDFKMGLKKAAVIYMVGGLDQVFREYLLASQLTRLLIVRHGNE